MYPQFELKRLAAHKNALRARVAVQRADYAVAVSRATQPLAWVDRVRDFFHRCSPLAPFAAVPLGLVVQRTFFPKLKILGGVLRWGPAVFAAFRRRGQPSSVK
jgi:hypothetical protein